MKAIGGCLILIPSLVLICPNSQAAIIDDFNQGTLSFQVTNYSGSAFLQSGLSLTSVLGGSRSVYAGTLELATCSIANPEGKFSFRSDSSFGYFKLQYGVPAALNADLTSDSSDRFVLNLSGLTAGLWRGLFTFSVETGNSWHNYDFSRDLFALSGPGSLTIPYSRFSGADFAHVQAITIDVGRFEPGFQIALDSLVTIPEPSMVSLWLASFGAGFLTRRSRHD